MASVMTLGCLVLVLAGALRYYARDARIPSVCWILLVGVGYGLVRHYGGLDSLPDASLSPETTFHLFLPVLIYTASRRLTLGELRRAGPGAAVLASVGVALTLLVISGGLIWVLGLGSTEALLLAAALTPTDPLAIGAIIRRLGAPDDLRTLIETESMFNDGVALVLFGIFSSMVLGRSVFVANHPVSGFGLVILGGVAVGIGMGWGIYELLKRWQTGADPVISALVLLSGVYLTFYIAEALLHVSGVIAVMTTGIALSRLHREAEADSPPEAAEQSDCFLENFWQVMSLAFNALLFFSLGAMIGGHRWNLGTLTVPLLIVLLLLARGVGVYGGGLLLRPTPWRVPWNWLHAVNIAGLKGALTVAMLLTLPEDYQHRQVFVCTAFVLVLSTILLNPLVGQWHMRRIENPPYLQ